MLNKRKLIKILISPSGFFQLAIGLFLFGLGLYLGGIYLFDFFTVSERSSFPLFAFALGTIMLGSGILVSTHSQMCSPQANWQWMSSVETGNNSIQKRLELLADECGDDALQEIILVFLEECLSKIIRLQHLIYDPDKFNLIMREAHTLRGACLNLGAIEMAELSADLEAAASVRDVEDVSFIVNQLKSEFNRTYFVIHTGLRETMTVK
jgi:HPt (histidine-containing phosphotransfer) domain-containing protein